MSVIIARHWKNFCAHPHAAVVPIVRKFYANAYEHENRVTFYRDKRVPFNSLTINQFYNVLEIENDKYAHYADGNVNLYEVITFLCDPGTQWKISKRISVSFKANVLDKFFKI